MPYVAAQALWAENEHAVIAKLVVFDDGKRFERLTQTDAVRDDAPAQPFELVNVHARVCRGARNDRHDGIGIRWHDFWHSFDSGNFVHATLL